MLSIEELDLKRMLLKWALAVRAQSSNSSNNRVHIRVTDVIKPRF